MRTLFICSFMLLMQWSSSALAAPIETYTFETPAQEEAFYRLSDELRCLVCQNQNIAESNADLAKDLRREIYQMINEGQSEEQIIDFMVERYGDYVLYRPPFKPLTWLLWFGPAVIFFIGLFMVIRILKAQAKDKQAVTLSEKDLERIKQLHAEQGLSERQDREREER